MTSETKAKFDALLKAALKRKNVVKEGSGDVNKSTQNLISSEGTSLEGVDNLFENETQAEIHELRVSEEDENKKFLMNKFLEGSGEFVEVFKPVPKPRKSKPKIAEKIENDSNSSGGTYKITSPKVVAVGKSSSSSNSAATYVKSPKKETVGDILIHESLQQETHKNDDHYHVVVIEETKTSEEDDEMFIEERKTSEKQEIFAIQHTRTNKNDTVAVIRETKPKPKKRTKTIANTHEKIEPNQKQTEGKETPVNIMAITVHKTDRLDINSFISHPLVQIHIINSETGLYLQKSDTSRSVVFYYENQDLNFISPVLTQTYDLKKHR